jgi:hypothetical protein
VRKDDADPERGLYQKFQVSRLDGRDAPGGEREGAEYFVLDLTYDPFAVFALEAYAEACATSLPNLAADLWSKARAMRERPHGR